MVGRGKAELSVTLDPDGTANLLLNAVSVELGEYTIDELFVFASLVEAR